MAILTQSATLKCPHQAMASVAFSPNSSVYIEGSLAITKDDVITIAGCPFTTGGSASPCIRVVWKQNHAAVKAGANLVSDSHVAMCVNPAGVEQGPLVIVPVATKVTG